MKILKLKCNQMYQKSFGYYSHNKEKYIKHCILKYVFILTITETRSSTLKHILQSWIMWVLKETHSIVSHLRRTDDKKPALYWSELQQDTTCEI